MSVHIYMYGIYIYMYYIFTYYICVVRGSIHLGVQSLIGLCTDTSPFAHNSFREAVWRANHTRKWSIMYVISIQSSRVIAYVNIRSNKHTMPFTKCISNNENKLRQEESWSCSLYIQWELVLGFSPYACAELSAPSRSFHANAASCARPTLA